MNTKNAREIIAGQRVLDALDAERAAQCVPSSKYPGCFDSESLCTWQRSVHRRGFEGAELCKTIFGWSVRSDTGLDDFQVLAGHRDGQLPNAAREQAAAWAVKWQAERPEHRYVTCRAIIKEAA